MEQKIFLWSILGNMAFNGCGQLLWDSELRIQKQKRRYKFDRLPTTCIFHKKRLLNILNNLLEATYAKNRIKTSWQRTPTGV